jgi:hypothetical protein
MRQGHICSRRCCLEFVHIRVVQQKLIRKGLLKYDQLVRFNMWIIGFSLSTDCLIIGMLSVKNPVVYVWLQNLLVDAKQRLSNDRYMQFHPLANIVKLNIDISMAEPIAKASCSSNYSAGKGLPNREALVFPDDSKPSYSLTRRPDRRATRFPKSFGIPRSDSFSSFISSDSRFDFQSHSFSREDNGTFNMEREAPLV